MNRTIEFKNFIQIDDLISVDLYSENNFIVTLSASISHITNLSYTDIGLYEYFRKAALIYIQHKNDSNLGISNSTSYNIH